MGCKNCDKKLIIGSAAVIILALAAGYFLAPEQRTVFGPPANLKIDEYSVAGQVLQIKNEKIVFNAGMVFITKEGKNVFDYVKRTALVNDKTEIYRDNNFSARLQISDIQVGAEITVYSSQNPANTAELLAGKIIVK